MYLNSVNAILGNSKLVRLTLTWDVFKYVPPTLVIAPPKGLTLTWDVFKSNNWNCC